MELTSEEIKKIILEELASVVSENKGWLPKLEQLYSKGDDETILELLRSLGDPELRKWYIGKRQKQINDQYDKDMKDPWLSQGTEPIEYYNMMMEELFRLEDELMSYEPDSLEEKKKTKKDACYHKVKSRYDVWPSAYASGALTKCRKVGAKNWGNKSKKNETISESLRYHQRHGVGVEKNVFRPGSQAFFGLFREARQLFREGRYKIHTEEEKEIIESDLGEFGLYEGMEVPLDFPMVMEQDEMEFLDEKKKKKKKAKKKDPPLNKPSLNTGGGKKWKVYVRSKSGGIKKVTYGDKKGGLKGNWNNKEARKSFAARHNCADKKDKTTSGYWACRAHKDFGKNVPGRFW